MYNEPVFFKKAVLKHFAVFTEKDLCCSLFVNKNAGLQSWNHIKKRLQHRCFPVNIAKFLGKLVLKNICERLFERFPTWANNITSNIGIEEDIFSKAKQNKNHSKTQLNKKNLPFHDALDHFVFLYISTACLRRRLPYKIKNDCMKDFKTG